MYCSGDACAVFPVAICWRPHRKVMGCWIWLKHGDSAAPVNGEGRGQSPMRFVRGIGSASYVAWCAKWSRVRFLQRCAASSSSRVAVWECPPYGGRSCVAYRVCTSRFRRSPRGSAAHTVARKHIISVLVPCGSVLLLDPRAIVGVLGSCRESRLSRELGAVCVAPVPARALVCGTTLLAAP